MLRFLAISLSPSVCPVSPSPSAVVATRVKVRWSIWQGNTLGMKARLLLVIVDHEDGEVVSVTVLLSLQQTSVLLNKDQIANLEIVVEDTEGVDGVTIDIVTPVGHCHLTPSLSLPVLIRRSFQHWYSHLPNVPDSPIEMLVIWLYSQGPGRNVAVAKVLLPLRPEVGGGVVTIERFW